MPGYPFTRRRRRRAPEPSAADARRFAHAAIGNPPGRAAIVGRDNVGVARVVLHAHARRGLRSASSRGVLGFGESAVPSSVEHQQSLRIARTARFDPTLSP
jgi:hypothetical protein